MIQTIASMGAGVIGHGCALHFALHGYPVVLYDPDPAALDRAMALIAEELALLAEEGMLPAGDVDAVTGRITPTGDFAYACTADYLLENAPEQLSLKQRLFADMEAAAGPEAIFASDTSSLKLSDIIAQMTPAGQSRALLSHWYNPAHILPIIELSYFGNTSDAVYGEVEALYKTTGKAPVKVLRDVPGQVANRIQHAVAREVFAMIEAGVASAEDIDLALKSGPAFRYAVAGQLEVADFGGLDSWTRAAANLWPEIDRSTAPSPLLREKVEAGKLGVKSGEGFFTYPEATRAAAKRDFDRRLLRQLRAGGWQDQ